MVARGAFFDKAHEYCKAGVGSHLEVFLPSLAMHNGMKTGGIKAPTHPSLPSWSLIPCLLSQIAAHAFLHKLIAGITFFRDWVPTGITLLVIGCIQEAGIAARSMERWLMQTSTTARSVAQACWCILSKTMRRFWSPLT